MRSRNLGKTAQMLNKAELLPLGRDVFMSLPTGEGKSLCYATFPLAFDWLRERYVLRELLTRLSSLWPSDSSDVETSKRGKCHNTSSRDCDNHSTRTPLRHMVTQVSLLQTVWSSSGRLPALCIVASCPALLGCRIELIGEAPSSMKDALPDPAQDPHRFFNVITGVDGISDSDIQLFCIDFLHKLLVAGTLCRFGSPYC